MFQSFRERDDLLGQVDNYLTLLGCGVEHYRSGLQLYLQDRPDEFSARRSELRVVARKASEVRWRLSSRFCRPSRLFSNRGDLAAFLEATTGILSLMNATLQQLAVEQPEPALDGNALLVELAGSAKHAVGGMALTARAHFTGAADVATEAASTREVREEADRLREKYTRLIFRMDLHLSHKNQLCSVAATLDRIADMAADAADRLASASVGREEAFTVRTLGQMATGWLVLSIAAVALTFAVVTLLLG